MSPGRLSSRRLTRARASSASSRARSRPCSETYGKLAGSLVLPRRLAELLGRARRVEDVVDDLEEDAELVANTRHSPRSSHSERPATAVAVVTPARREPPGLQGMKAPEPLGVQLSVPGDVEVLAADHSKGRLGDLARDPRRRIPQRKAERLSEQRIAGEDGDVLAEDRTY